MNTSGLTRLYDQLTVWERIPLIVSAYARDDEHEFRKLFDSSPIREWSLPEHLLAEQALHILALIYIGEQLGAAANYFFALWQLEIANDQDAKQWLHASQSRAYFFKINADAWQRFCAELGVSASDLTAANYRGRFLRYCEEHMPANAPAEEVARAIPRAAGLGERPVRTADDLLASWRSLLQKMTSHATPH